MTNRLTGLMSFINSHIADIMASALTSYLIISVINIFIATPEPSALNFVEDVDGIVEIIEFLALSIGLSILAIEFRGFGEKAVYSLMLVSVILFAILVVYYNNDDIYIATGVSAVTSFFIYHILSREKIFKNKIISSYKTAFIIVAIAYVLMTIWMSKHTIARYLSFSSSNFDMGIFAQLFENMAKTGSTVISVERNEMLSHFYNHFSPIYYVLLPLYMPFRTPEALLVIQAAFVLASAFPFCLIAKKYGFAPIVTMFLGLIVIFAPGFVAPMFYDFHENKFLPFFILWFIYLFIDKKYIPSYIFMFLTLMIKEDAAIYVIFTLIYFMVVNKEIKHSLIGLGLTILYFVPVMIFIRSYGLDFVGWRYSLYFLSGQDKIIQMVQNILMNPAFFVKNLFSEECFVFILYMLGSLLFIPLATKDFKRLILLIPFVAINIMTDYKYQHNIGFQYTYGSLALIMLLFLANLKDIKENMRVILTASALTVSFLMMLSHCQGAFEGYSRNYNNNVELFEQTERELDRIPEDVSITSNTFILPHLYDRENLYMLDDNYRRTDYYVLDCNNSDEISEFEDSEEYAEYVKVSETGKAAIYKLPEAPDLLAQY